MNLQKLKTRGGAFASAACALALALTAACGPRGGGGPSGGSSSARVQGAGASFPAPLYQKWLSEYRRVNASASIDYQSTGSGAGVKQFSEGTIDFGATDQAMTDEELQKVQGEVVHIPTALGAVVVTYNLSGVSQPLRFSPDVLADIFLGRITRWNDPRVAADNAGVQLPDAQIGVVHRSDGSGTSAVFTDYLSKVSPEWKQRVGVNKAPTWPVGQGGKGNEGVTGMIKQQPNTIGYVELAFARQARLPVALLKNAAGNFVEPSLDAVTAAAAESVATTPEDLRVSVTNAAGAQAYPIASYTYVLLHREQRDAAKGKAVVDFLWWALHDGTEHARALDYAPLPPEILKRVEAKLNSITSAGKPLRG
ncbi:MAG TPA: phosphate ABC transporter substrate-binding protein PstS [Pyrinomonadaceae bacterium]|nr:phosphate ABC transporter substrate-binding protein PstS [Pyrinomonadaceae bacterium]